MIFVTVGGQLPFDRLVECVDSLAPKFPEEFFGQIGNARYIPRNFAAVDYLSPSDYKQKFIDARVVISHAGIGSILTAKQTMTPIVVMPRLVSLREHRNDHQIATSVQLSKVVGVYIANNKQQIMAYLEQENLIAAENKFSESRAQLVASLRLMALQSVKNR